MSIEAIIFFAFFLDLILGDPPQMPHPVKWIGKLARFLERKTRELVDDPLIAGVITALIVYSLSFGIPWMMIYFLSKISQFLADLLTVLIIYTTLALRSLVSHSRAVLQELAQLHLTAAREKVSLMVGRDTGHLSRKGVIRACLESVAESMVDGMTAPLFFAIFLGAPGAMLYRSINTLDSIFGHRCERYECFGKFSARIDDFANFIPSRITAPLVSIAALFLNYHPLKSIKILIRDGHKHPSPNSGLSEAAIAGALGIKLGGVNYYHGELEIRPQLGDDQNNLRVIQIVKANQLIVFTSFITCAVYLFINWFIFKNIK